MSRNSLAERFKPSIKERLAQSEKDKRTKGARKLKAVREEPVEVIHLPPPVTMNTWDPLETRIITNTVTGGGTVWRIWTSNSATTCDVGWEHWNNLHTPTITTSSTTWSLWNEFTDNPSRHGSPRTRIAQDPYGRIVGFEVVETEEEKRFRLEQYERAQKEQREYEARMAEAARVKREAYDRALELLKSCLNAEQRDNLEKHRYFFVKAPSGRRYRIDEGTHGNLKVVDKDGFILERLCVQPNGVPAGDAMLVQKLMIETAEDALRRHANITLANGQLLRGDPTNLDNTKLADVIPIRRVA